MFMAFLVQITPMKSLPNLPVGFFSCNKATVWRIRGRIYPVRKPSLTDWNSMKKTRFFPLTKITQLLTRVSRLECLKFFYLLGLAITDSIYCICVCGFRHLPNPCKMFYSMCVIPSRCCSALSSHP